MREKKILLMASIFMIASMVSMTGLSQANPSEWEKVKLIEQVYSTGVSAGHATFLGLNPYFKKLEEVSGGKLKTKVFPGGVLFKLKVALKGLKEGGCDSAHIVISYHPSELPTTNLITDCLLNMTNPVAASGATCEMLGLNSEFFEEELKANNVYMFGSYASDVYHLHSRAPRTTLADMRGAKVRCGGGAHVRFIKGLGGVPVAMPTTQAYEALMRGTIDGCVGAIDFQRSFGFWDVCPYVTEMGAGLFNGVPAPSFRRDWFDALPKVAKRAIVENYGIVPARVTITGYIEQGKKTRRIAVEEKGTKILKAAPDLKAAIAEFIAGDTKGLIDMAVDQRGLKREKAAQIVQTYLSLYQKWEKLADEVIKDDVEEFERQLRKEVYEPLANKMGLK